MEQLAKITKDSSEAAAASFFGPTMSFADKVRQKESAIGLAVDLYHRFFNLEDRFDHLLSNSDPPIPVVMKEGRFIEDILLVALINAYTLDTETRMSMEKSPEECYLAVHDANGSRVPALYPREDYLMDLARALAGK